MTGYHIQIGYNGAIRTAYEDYDAMWAELKSTAREIANNPKKIIEEARRLGASEACDKGCCKLETYADNYLAKFGGSGHPISIIEKGEDKQIM
ncbi:MAG: hypothetical protein HQ594_00865, partial [Candidatus Omnitrophica bacterium]|nr:hypothetical protein [Candidatus Omnitrophota bacterium]